MAQITRLTLNSGALLPVMAARSNRLRVPPLAFFITKYFGSGVIIATAFIHVGYRVFNFSGRGYKMFSDTGNSSLEPLERYLESLRNST